MAEAKRSFGDLGGFWGFLVWRAAALQRKGVGRRAGGSAGARKGAGFGAGEAVALDGVEHFKNAGALFVVFAEPLHPVDGAVVFHLGKGFGDVGACFLEGMVAFGDG